MEKKENKNLKNKVNSSKSKEAKKLEESYKLGWVLQYTQLDKQNLRAYLIGGYDENGNATTQTGAQTNKLGIKYYKEVD